MGIRERARDLAFELQKTSVFAELQQSKSVIDKSPALRQELENFNRRQNALYSSKIPAAETNSRLEQLEGKFQELSKIPEVDRYLKALKNFNMLLSDTLKEINATIGQSLR